jgi:hypothetical protein
MAGSLLWKMKCALSMLAGLMKQTFWGWRLNGHCCLLGRLPMSHGLYLSGWHLMGHDRYQLVELRPSNVHCLHVLPG